MPQILESANLFGLFIHRYGCDWIMLMFGGSVFSLVIVDVPEESRDFFFTFYCGVFTVVLLCFLHFHSQPHDPNCHALRRSKDAGVAWTNVGSVYSFALVCLEYFAREEENLRRLATMSSTGDGETDRERSAHLFCGSLAIIFACLGTMALLHVGWEEGCSRMNAGNKKNIVGLLVLATRLAIIPFIATVSQWETDPSTLAMIGLLCVLGQLALRKASDVFLIHKEGSAAADPTSIPAAAEGAGVHPRHFRQSSC